MAMKILKIVFLVYFFLASLVAFLPKKNLYYYGEEKLSRLKTIITNEHIKEGLFSLELRNADIYVEKIRVAKVMEARLQTYLLSTHLEAHQIRLSGMVKNFLPTKIEILKMRYDLWDPLKVKFTVSGEFGKASGKYLLAAHKIIVVVHPSKMMRSRYPSILRKMKKEKNGGYSYEQRFY